MTGQTMLNVMEVLNAELQLQTGEADVTRGLLALNVAQDYFESLAAGRGKMFNSSTGTLTAVSGVERTALPAALLQLDRLQRLDDDTGLPVSELKPSHRAGGHAAMTTWPMVTFATSSGAPQNYWTNGRSIYWNPLPDADYLIRWYGFSAASDLTADGDFAYPDIVVLPMAAFAVQLIKGGLDDAAQDVAAMAQTAFGTVLDTLSHFARDGAVGLEYTQIHLA